VGLALACGLALIGSVISIQYATYRYYSSWIGRKAIGGFCAYNFVNAAAAAGVLAIVAHSVGWGDIQSLGAGAIAGAVTVGGTRFDLTMHQDPNASERGTLLKHMAAWVFRALGDDALAGVRAFFYVRIEDRPLADYVRYLFNEFVSRDPHLADAVKRAYTQEVSRLVVDLAGQDTIAHDDAKSNLAKYACEWTSRYQARRLPLVAQ
jgi:hypothetical protein